MVVKVKGLIIRRDCPTVQYTPMRDSPSMQYTSQRNPKKSNLVIVCATAPCTLHSASDGLPLADRLWMETLGGPNEKPVRSSVTD